MDNIRNMDNSNGGQTMKALVIDTRHGAHGQLEVIDFPTKQGDDMEAPFIDLDVLGKFVSSRIPELGKDPYPCRVSSRCYGYNTEKDGPQIGECSVMSYGYDDDTVAVSMLYNGKKQADHMGELAVITNMHPETGECIDYSEEQLKGITAHTASYIKGTKKMTIPLIAYGYRDALELAKMEKERAPKTKDKPRTKDI